MPAGAARVLTGYLTFFSVRGGWVVHEGIGDHGPAVGRLPGAPPATYLAQTVTGQLWAAVGAITTAVERIAVPALDREPLPAPGARIGALAVAPGGGQALVTALPSEAHGEVRLLRWEPPRWSAVAVTTRPHISSGLAWLDEERVVFESAGRRLTLLDLGTGRTEEVAAGSLPAAAPAAGTWYAVTAGRVVAFPYAPPFRPAAPDFRCRTVSRLSVTPDGAACLWTEPAPMYRVRGFAQRLGGRRVRVRSLDAGTGIILRPG